MGADSTARRRRILAVAAGTGAACAAAFLGAEPREPNAVLSGAGQPLVQPTPPAPAVPAEPTVALPAPGAAAAPAAPMAPRARTGPPPPPLFPLPADAAYPQPCPKRKPVQASNGRTSPATDPKVATGQLPPALGTDARRVDLTPVTGKGMWLTNWEDTEVDVPRLVAQARSAGLQQLWVRTGGSRQGWYGAKLLTELLPVAHAAGLKVIAWDFPTLSNPAADARRAYAAVKGVFAGHKIDAFSPDIETRHEGTYNSTARVEVYLSRVRQAAGDMPIVATVMRPTRLHLKTYPYAAIVPYVDAFAPMVYWSCNEPGHLAAESVAALARMRPVHLVGQSYDMGPEGGRRGMPTAKEIWRFLDAGLRAGAIGASLYNYNQAGRAQWTALSRYPWPPAERTE